MVFERLLANFFNSEFCSSPNGLQLPYDRIPTAWNTTLTIYTSLYHCFSTKLSSPGTSNTQPPEGLTLLLPVGNINTQPPEGLTLLLPVRSINAQPPEGLTLLQPASNINTGPPAGLILCQLGLTLSCSSPQAACGLMSLLLENCPSSNQVRLTLYYVITALTGLAQSILTARTGVLGVPMNKLA